MKNNNQKPKVEDTNILVVTRGRGFVSRGRGYRTAQ